MPAPVRLGLLGLFVVACAACAASATTSAPAPLGARTAGPPASNLPRTTPAQADASPTGVLVTMAPTPTPVEPTPTPDAQSCSGNADNKSFFADAARQLKWAVYCAVLPNGWFLLTGKWDLRSGGQMTIAYQGPGGVNLEIKEGAYCTPDGDDGTDALADAVCQTQTDAVGPTLFGDQTGTLFRLQPGFAVYVSAAAKPPSWAAATVDLDESTFVKLVAGLHHVKP